MFSNIPNIFNDCTEFVELDPRRLRLTQTASAESLYNRCEVIVPKFFVEHKTVLDLGSAIGAMGHYALTAGCKHYTGVDISNYYVDTSKHVLAKYWHDSKFSIVHQDVEQFLDNAIEIGQRWDYVIVSGILYSFVDCASLLKKISKVATDNIVVDTANWSSNSPNTNYGTIVINKVQYMSNPLNKDENNTIFSTGSRLSLRALDIIMETCSFSSSGIICPKLIKDVHDPYNTFEDLEDGSYGPRRIIVRYTRTNSKLSTIQDQLLEVNNPTTETNINPWQFNEDVANRFEHEALTNIPSYKTVIDKCVEFAKSYVPKNAPIIDVGSALGYTMRKFDEAGFTNVMGVESSQPMINKSYKPDRVILSNTLPAGHYRMVMANWTLHFVEDKLSYIKDIYNSLEIGGFLILTDKTTQSVTVKDMYRTFKLNNGISAEYVNQKEEQLKTVMHTKPVSWYLEKLRLTNFNTTDIIHTDLGFVTFLCVK